MILELYTLFWKKETAGGNFGSRAEGKEKGAQPRAEPGQLLLS